MFIDSALLLTVAVLPVALAASFPRSSNTSASEEPTVTTIEPCGQISALLAPYGEDVANANPRPTLPARLAYDCLTSVPLHLEEALQFVDGIVPYLQWESDLVDIKEPPSDYDFPAHDVVGALSAVRSNLVAGKYSNEYEFQIDLYKVTGKAHNGHFILYPDLISKVLTFARPARMALVSVSEDGLKLPQVYFADDAIKNNSKASAVIKINGVETTKYIESFTYDVCGYQDLDTCYNTNFRSVASGIFGGLGDFQGYGRGSFLYPGDNTTMDLANGTTVVRNNYATAYLSFTNVTDGESFYETFCRGTVETNITTTSVPPSKVKRASATSSAPAVTSLVPGYPLAKMKTSDNTVAGYYIDDPAYSHVAVLSILDFLPTSAAQFQAVIQDFLSTAKADGKTKIVVDLSANPGGYLLLGFDVFRQFFPKIVQHDESRMRTNDAFFEIASLAGNATNVPVPTLATANVSVSQYGQPFNYRWSLNATLGAFPDVESLTNGPRYKDTGYTSLLRWNLTDPWITSEPSTGLGITITGYLERANATQYYSASDIIMVFDGACSSNCFILSNFMKQAGVKSLVFGGRPNSNPMQAVGGVKGVEAYSFKTVYDAGTRYYYFGTDEQKALLDTYNLTPTDRSSYAGLNVRDGIMPSNFDDGVPAQFVRENADCRLFFTADMINDVSAIWKAAANAAWNGGKCVNGALTGNMKRDGDGDEDDNVSRAPVTGGTSRFQSFAAIDLESKSDNWKEMHIQKMVRLRQPNE